MDNTGHEPTQTFTELPISPAGVPTPTRVQPEAVPSRTIWPIVLTAVVAALLLAAAGVAAYVVYEKKTNEISDLKQDRGKLQTTNAALFRQVAAARSNLRTANGKLTATTKT